MTVTRQFMELKDIILAACALLGPIISASIAIYYTRYADKQKIINDRRFEVFRNLMKTRGFPLHQDHVMSLNLIQADFHDNSDVMTKFRDYINHLYRPIPPEVAESQRFFAEREMLFGKFIKSIAKSLQIVLDPEEIKHFTYFPSGWASIENEQQQLRKLLINVLQGTAPISVKPAIAQQPIQPGLFPEPPK